MTAGGRALGLCLGVALLGAAGVGAPNGYAWWASRGRIVSVTDAPTRDVAVILGAEVYPSGTPSPYLRARLDLGVRLFRDGRARVLLVSGDDAPEHNRETASMRAYLVGKGIPASRICSIGNASSTVWSASLSSLLRSEPKSVAEVWKSLDLRLPKKVSRNP